MGSGGGRSLGRNAQTLLIVWYCQPWKPQKDLEQVGQVWSVWGMGVLVGPLLVGGGRGLGVGVRVLGVAGDFVGRPIFGFVGFVYDLA